MNHRPFTLEDAIRGILLRRRTVVVFFLTICFLIGLATILAERTYKSDARLFMRLGRENTSLDATATMGEHPVVMLPESREAEINSIVELIQSKQLYEKVVDEIGEDRILESDWRPEEEGPPKKPSWTANAVGQLMGALAAIGVLDDVPRREKAVIRLQKDVEIEAFEKSNVLTVGFETYDPYLAQEIVQRLVGHYQTQHVELHRPARAYEFLEEETRRVESELARSRVELEDFKNETGILEPSQQRTVLIQRIATLKSDLLLADATQAALETEVTQLQDGLSRLSATTTMSETVGAGNQGADSMRQELYRLEVEREQFAARYTARNPKLQQIDNQLRQARSILQDAEKGRREAVVGPNKIYQETAVSLEQKRPSLAAEKAKIAKLKKQIEAIEDELDQFTSNERIFARLERNVEILEANFRKRYSNLEQARIDARMQSEEFSNVGVAQPATLNLKPHSPKKLINLCVAVFLGAFGGMGFAAVAEYLNPSLATDEDIEQAIGASVIASVPDLNRQQLLATLGSRLPQASNRLDKRSGESSGCA